MEAEQQVAVLVQNPRRDSVQSEPESAAGPGAGGGCGEARSGSLELGRRLLAAARDGDCDAVLDLMSQGAPFTTDWLGTSALHAAAARGQARAAALLLRAGALRDAANKVERTPLHVAAYCGHDDVCALLLAHGARADCRDMLGMTPLAWAVERGRARAAALLLERGADPDLRSKFRTSPRDIAARSDRQVFLDMIEKAMKKRAENPSPPRADQEAELKEAQKEYIIITDRSKVMSKAGQQKKTPSPDTASNRVPPSPKKADAEAGPGGAEGAAARLLRAHGITLLPPDTGGTVLSALRAGRTVLLSDAGKLMLKESGQVAFTSGTAASPATPATPGGAATPSATPGGAAPRRVIPRVTSNITLKKVINANNKVKYVALPTPLPRAPAPPRLSPAPALRVLRPAAPAPAPVLRPAAPSPAPAADTTVSTAGASAISTPKPGPGVVRVPAEFLTSTSVEYLRAQLLAAHAELAAARRGGQ